VPCFSTRFTISSNAIALAPQVLGGKLLAHRLLDVEIDVARRHRTDAAVLGHIFEEVLPGQVLRPLGDPGEVAVGDRHGALDSVLSGIGDPEFSALNPCMAVAERGRSEALVLLGIFLVADSHPGLVDQTDDGGEHGLARRRLALQILVEALPELRKAASEAREALIFAALLLLAERGVVAILLPALRVEADRLDMAAGVRAEPAALVSGRHPDRVQSVDLVAVGDPLAVCVEIHPVAAAALAGDAGAAVVRISEHER
jgi:hypothetical protein